jgi:hypothetical protein
VGVEKDRVGKEVLKGEVVGSNLGRERVAVRGCPIRRGRVGSFDGIFRLNTKQIILSGQSPRRIRARLAFACVRDSIPIHPKINAREK